MCGIAGILNRSRAVEAGQLEAMARQISHRGPDSSGSYRRDGLGLVHTRLAIIDLTGGTQPLCDETGDLVLIANGEIYNFIELRAELRARGYRFRTSSDCEVILHAYAEFGVQALQRLHGMFAFALYDWRRRRLVLARDRLGIKPLFVARSAAGWLFASEVKALLPQLAHGVRVNAGALAQYLYSGSVYGEETLLAGVTQVPPGHALIIDQEMRSQEYRYWSIAETPPYRGSEADALERFSELFEQTLIEHMRSDVPYGLFLSGGVDSGTLACLLSGRQASALNTYSLAFAGSKKRNELDDAERVARVLGTAHHRFEIEPREAEARIVEAVWAADGLIQDPAILPTLILAQEAGREQKVIFTGEGADEVFAGYVNYHQDRPGRRLMAMIDRKGGGMNRHRRWRAAYRSLCFGPALRSAWAGRRRVTFDLWAQTMRSWGYVSRRQYVDLKTALPDGLLIKVDRALMAYGVEGRVPFLDHRIVEFGFSLPDGMKIRGGHRKYFLKRWAERHLSKEQLYVKKRGFHVPQKQVLSRRLARDLVQLLPEVEGIREWFRPEGVRRLLQRHEKQGNAGKEVWSLVLFGVWHALVIEGRRLQPEPGVSVSDILRSGSCGAVRHAASPRP